MKMKAVGRIALSDRYLLIGLFILEKRVSHFRAPAAFELKYLSLSLHSGQNTDRSAPEILCQ